MTAESSPPPLQPIRLLFRSKEAVELYTLPDTSSSSLLPCTIPKNTEGGVVTLYRGKTTFHVLNPSGNFAYIHDASIGLIRCDLQSTANTSAIPFLNRDSKAVQLAKCSPRGSYLVTWERPSNNASNNEGNLKVWDGNDGHFLKGFSCKKATLNTLQWTHDENLVFHLVTNEVHIYSTGANSDDGGGDIDGKRDCWKRRGKVRCPSVTSFSLPPVKGTPPNIITGSDSDKYLMTVFVPENKGKPARVDLLRYPDRMGRESFYTDGNVNEGDANKSGPALASKSLFNAEEANIKWSPRADAALLITQTSIDSTGQSYYGSTTLFLLLEKDARKPTQGLILPVSPPKEATKDNSGSVPIVHANWIPNPSISGMIPFTLISGRMPALASLHHGGNAEATFLFGRAHRNTMDISPHGRFIVVGGYGNLAGGMDFWDRNKGKMIPRHVFISGSTGGGGNGHEIKYVTMKEPSDLSITSPSPVVGHQWAPDSRTYLVSTTSPRMNVDNGVRIYRYDGTLVNGSDLPWDNAKYQPDKLLCAEYVPPPSLVGKDEFVITATNTSSNSFVQRRKNIFFYYPDRPQSPPPCKYATLTGEAATGAIAKIRQSQSSSSSNDSKPRSGTSTIVGGGAYVPPGARKAGVVVGSGIGGAYVPPGARRGVSSSFGSTGTSLAERMRQEREGSAATVSAKKVNKRSGPVGSASVVGANCNNNGGGKSKNAIRREKQRQAKEKAQKEALEAEQRAIQLKLEEEKTRAEFNAADPEKRAKKIKKTLKQILDIKKKLENGAELNEDQLTKIQMEESLRKELIALGLDD